MLRYTEVGLASRRNQNAKKKLIKSTYNVCAIPLPLRQDCDGRCVAAVRFVPGVQCNRMLQRTCVFACEVSVVVQSFCSFCSICAFLHFLKSTSVFLVIFRKHFFHAFLLTRSWKKGPTCNSMPACPDGEEVPPYGKLQFCQGAVCTIDECCRPPGRCYVLLVS